MPDNIPTSPCIVGIGTDLTEVARIKKLMDDHGDSFLKKVFTAAEIEYCKARPAPEIHYAARFAAKEAVAKVLGTGFDSRVSLSGISVEKDELGAPYVVLNDAAKSRLEEIGAQKILLSITHTKELAQAFALASK